VRTTLRVNDTTHELSLDSRWAENYDRILEEVFEVQDDVVRTIRSTLMARVRKAETERARSKPLRAGRPTIAT